MSVIWLRGLSRIALQSFTSQTVFQRFLPTVRHTIDPAAPTFETENVDDPSVITVPLKLKSRLEKKRVTEGSKSFHRKRLTEISRRGNKSHVIISCKRPEFNYYKNEHYGKREEIPLCSKGWLHKQSKGDFFIIHPVEDDAFVELEGKETFEALGLRQKIDAALQERGIKYPTLIQATAIPELLKRTNNLMAAETGCGKTLAYLLPVFDQILERKFRRLKREPNQPYAICLVPTRELAEQVNKVATGLGRALDITVKTLQGGSVVSKIHNPPSKEVDLLVSTTSIISTLSAADVYDLTKVRHVVLDEADTLLDDSFSPDVLPFLARFNFKGLISSKSMVQATLVSATMPRSIENILGEVINVDALRRITTPNLHRVAKTVPQKFMRVRKMDKPQIILGIVNKALVSNTPTMIFCNKNQTCHWLNAHLTASGIDCIMIHGKILPSKRRGLLEAYHSGEVNVVVCTDLASRGIDSIRTKQVVNYEFPNFVADYVHRCGRVGRVGSGPGGIITNLISSGNEVELVQKIETSVRKNETLQKVNANIKQILNSKYGMYQTIDPIKPDEDYEKNESNK